MIMIATCLSAGPSWAAETGSVKATEEPNPEGYVSCDYSHPSAFIGDEVELDVSYRGKSADSVDVKIVGDDAWTSIRKTDRRTFMFVAGLGAAEDGYEIRLESGDSVLLCSVPLKIAAPTRPDPGDSHTDAVAWWSKHKDLLEGQLQRQLEKDGAGKRPIIIAHGPTGQQLPPESASATEGRLVQLAVVAKDGPGFEASVDTCEAFGNWWVRDAEEAEEQDNEEAPATADDDREPATWRLIPIGQYFRCGAGTLKYTLKPTKGDDDDDVAKKAASRDFTYTFHKRHHLALVAVPSFNFSMTSEFAAFDDRSAQDAGKAGTEADASSRVITETEDRVGVGVYMGAIWHPFGVDYHRMRAVDQLINPFAAVNVESPLSDLVIGNAVTPTGGLSIAVGVGIRPATVLDDGYQPGDPFDGDGDIPTRKSWAKARPGVVLGIAIDSDLYSALIKRFTK